MTSIIGAITALHGDLLQGWAYDPASPDARLIIDIQLDAVSVALVRADQPQILLDPGLSPSQDQDQHQDQDQAHNSIQGDGYHGFTARIPLSWLQDAQRLSAHIANQDAQLAGTLELTQSTAATAAPAPPVSRVYYSGGLCILGWVWDPAAPDRHVSIQAQIGERVVAHTRADQPHPDLARHSTLDHGFTLELPWELADGHLHQLNLITDQGQSLTPVPITLCEYPQGLRDLLARYWPGALDDPALGFLRNLALK